MAIRRREFLLTSVGLALGGIGGVLGHRYLAVPAVSSAPVASPQGVASNVPESLLAEPALKNLKDGNRRFVEGQMMHARQTIERRTSIAQQQHPFAAVLGCSDSRVPPELLFDQGLGDLFVVREAGNVAEDDTLGSLEYAVAHLHVPLIVVLGHQNCGAVGAAVGAVVRDEPVEGHILRLVDDIAPAVWEVKDEPGDLVEHAVRANVRQVVRKLRLSGPILRTHEQRGELKVVGAYYDLHTGVVEWLEE
jgi:carbonic anhydrase